MVSGFVLWTCVIPMVIGGSSDKPTKAALFAGVVMALVAFAALTVPDAQLGRIATQSQFETATIQTLAVMPVMMVFGLIGYGLRRGLDRIRAGKAEQFTAETTNAPRARGSAR